VGLGSSVTLRAVPAARDHAVLAGSVAVFVDGAIVARRAGVTRAELRWFERVNGLSRQVYAPVWGLMQLGSPGGPLMTGAVMWTAGHRTVGTCVMTVETTPGSRPRLSSRA
jgi:hypothetical protein